MSFDFTGTHICDICGITSPPGMDQERDMKEHAATHEENTMDTNNKDLIQYHLDAALALADEAPYTVAYEQVGFENPKPKIINRITESRRSRNEDLRTARISAHANLAAALIAQESMPQVFNVTQYLSRAANPALDMNKLFPEGSDNAPDSDYAFQKADQVRKVFNQEYGNKIQDSGNDWARKALNAMFGVYEAEELFLYNSEWISQLMRDMVLLGAEIEEINIVGAHYTHVKKARQSGENPVSGYEVSIFAYREKYNTDDTNAEPDEGPTDGEKDEDTECAESEMSSPDEELLEGFHYLSRLLLKHNRPEQAQSVRTLALRTF